MTEPCEKCSKDATHWVAWRPREGEVATGRQVFCFGHYHEYEDDSVGLPMGLIGGRFGSYDERYWRATP